MTLNRQGKTPMRTPVCALALQRPQFAAGAGIGQPCVRSFVPEGCH